MAKPKPDVITCSECTQYNCHRHDKIYPNVCATTDLAADERAEIAALYAGDSLDGLINRVAAEVEGTYYCKINRIEETIAFARRIGAKLLGIATCVGLAAETKILVDILRTAGFSTRTAICKVGSIDKSEVGLAEELKIRPGFEASCNPVLQARVLNRHKTDLNIVMGLCVGHDSLFYRHSQAPVTTLVVKDRVLGHNPVAGLYTAKSYNRRLLDPDAMAKL
ncbi:DUF1847 domain-containing protein [Xanthobacteraceae bacterium Astr-EGSB]|uniref:DUF1847 domain-containing protein n=1 Tax=Astrobacterium formosum TaxID=3069710 RepID=UPI0027B7C863|nr:DUF1847 domain-containing protein [Xanthobacteraceae bacterium Astr-EGSB]